MIVNDKYLPLLDNKDRFLILYGGAGSGKSVFAAQKIVLRCNTEYPHKFLCLRKVGTTIRDSIFQEITDAITELNLWGEFTVNHSSKIFTHVSGNKIYCTGLDDPEKIKSIKGITGMWIDEATEFTEEDIDQLNIRIRGNKDHYIQYILTFNPIDENHFLKKKFIDNPPSNCTFIHTTYKDNLFLTDEDRRVLESFKDTNPLYYQVYCLGEWGVVDKSGKFLYTFEQEFNVSECEIDVTKPIKFSFDFNIDPFAVIVYQSDEDYLHVIDQIKLPNSDIEQVCDHVLMRFPQSKYFYTVTGDRTGYHQSGLKRGKTSYWAIIKNRLNLSDAQIRLRSKNLDLIESRILCNIAFQTKDIVIHPRCQELIDDCKYAKVDALGVLIKDRAKNKNDFLDCLRYALDCEYPYITRRPSNY